MKSFKDYVSDAEHAYNNPVVGDLFDLELGPTEVIESEVIAITEDGIVIAGTDSVVSLLEAYSRDHNSHYDDINFHTSEETPVEEDDVPEAKYQGREVPLGKPMAGDVKKSKVYVKNPKTGKVVKVNFGDKTMKIKKSNPKRRKSFRARHNCANPGPRTKARYWSCRAW
jgi:hypothetical protein